MTRPIRAFLLTLLTVALAGGPAWASRLVVASGGARAWLLNGEGAISLIDLQGGAAAPFGDGAGAADIAQTADGGTMFTLAPALDGRTTRLRSLDASSGQERARWDVRGRGRFVVVTSDGARACIVGLKAAGPGRDDDWILIVVDLATGKQTPPVSAGLTPVAVTLMEAPGSGAKVLLAAQDRVATFSLEPLRVSWFYKSPGENNGIAVPAASPVVCLLRGASLAIIDPARRPVEAGRVQLGEDDATSVVALPSRGQALAVSRDGRTGAVLHDDGLSLTLVDLAAGQALSTETLAAPRDLLASRLTDADAPDNVVAALASSTAPGGGVETRLIAAARAPLASPIAIAGAGPQPVARDTTTPEAPPTPAPGQEPDQKPEPTAPPSKEPAPPAAKPEPAPEEKFELKVIVPEPPRDAPVSVKPEQLAAPPKDPTPATSAPAPETPPAPILPPRPAAGGSLQGHLTGEKTLAREVLFYGPGNIIKLHARAPVGPDGSFSLPLPPAGTYRVVVSAGAGAHLFTRPEFRTLTVTEGAGGLEGIDFEVRGALK